MQRDALVIGPSVEPVTLADAKLWIRQDIADDDAIVTSLITAARRKVEAELRQSLITQTWDLFLEGFPSGGGYYDRNVRQSGMSLQWLPTASTPIYIPRPPLQSIVWVNYVDTSGNTQTVDPSVYRVGSGAPARIQPNYGNVWPVNRPIIDAVNIRYVSGYGNDGTSVSENIKTAIKMILNLCYDNRDGAFELPTTVQWLLGADDHGSYA